MVSNSTAMVTYIDKSRWRLDPRALSGSGRLRPVAAGLAAFGVSPLVPAAGRPRPVAGSVANRVEADSARLCASACGGGCRERHGRRRRFCADPGLYGWAGAADGANITPDSGGGSLPAFHCSSEALPVVCAAAGSCFAPSSIRFRRCPRVPGWVPCTVLQPAGTTSATCCACRSHPSRAPLGDKGPTCASWRPCKSCWWGAPCPLRNGDTYLPHFSLLALG